MENLDIIALSDTHGYLPEIKTPFDLMLICGDICPTHDHYYGYQINWFQHEFAEWINKLPFKNNWSRVVITWGNHDRIGERIGKLELEHFYTITDHKAVILRNEDYLFHYLFDLEKDGKLEVNTGFLKIFGTPYCKRFGNWAFMNSDEVLKFKYEFLPNDCDILISHDAPDINNLGMISMGDWSGENAGNKVLAEVIKEKKPKIALCGHIHSGNHNFEKIDDTWMANVSYVNEDYVPDHDILHFQINPETKELIK